jgi:hypothetical protein
VLQAPLQPLLIVETSCCQIHFYQQGSLAMDAFGRLMKAVGSLLRRRQKLVKKGKCTYDVKGSPASRVKIPGFTRLRDKE